MDFLKTITGKIVGGFVALAVVAGAISWYSMLPADRSAMLSGTGRIIGWLLAVVILPWATFFLSTYANKFDNNLAGAALVAFYTIAEVVLLGWLFDWNVRGAAAWTFFIVGTLLAAAYNLFICDWIAEKAG